MGKMKPYAKLALIQNARQEGGRGAESRFRDRRGREHYDNGRFAPMRGEMNMEDERMEMRRGGGRGGSGGRSEMEMGYGGMDGGGMEMRRGGGRGGSGGRSEMEMGYGGMDGGGMEMRRGGGRGGSGGRSEMEMGYGNMGGEEMEMRRGGRRGGSGGRSEMEMGYGDMGGEEMEMEGGYGRNRYPYRPFGPFPVYRGAGMRSGGGEMRQIGFDPYREVESNYPMNAGYEMRNEMAYRKGSRMEGGYAKGMGEEEEVKPMNKEMAEMWVQSMKGANGAEGQHWSMEQAKQIMQRHGFQLDPVEFYVALNMMKSDYAKVAQKMGVDKEEFYACMAKAFLDDEDANKNKLALYHHYIAKKM